MSKKINRGGMALALVVITLGIVGVSVALVLTQSSLSSLAIHKYAQEETLAREILAGCQDEVNAQLRRSPTYAPATVSIGSSTCILAVVSSGNSRAITLTYTDSTITKRLYYSFDITTYVITAAHE